MYLTGSTLYAIQNGTTPERVMRFDLSPDLARIVGSSVVEHATPSLGDPTHGALVGHFFYFLENTGWGHFADDGRLIKQKAAPPRLARMAVGG
jgi:hypothetical protein